MRESTLWSWFKEKAHTNHWHTVRIESSTQLGIPDINYCAKSGMEGWVELKCAPVVKKTGVPAWQHPLTVQQEEFLLKRHRNNSCSGILCQVGKERFFISAAYAADFNEMTIDELRAANILDEWMLQ